MTDEELKPLTFGQVIDKTCRLGFSCIRSFLPVYLLNFFLFTAFFALSNYIFSLMINIDFIDIFSGHALSSGRLNQNILELLLYYVVISFVTLPAIYTIAIIMSLTIKSYLNQEANLWKEAGYIAKKYPAILITAIIATFIILLGTLACGVGMFTAMLFLAFYIPAMIYENNGIFGAINRSIKLTSYSFWQLLVTFFLPGLIISLFSLGVELVVNSLILKLSGIEGGYKDLMVGLLNGGENFRNFTVLLAAGTAITMINVTLSIIDIAMRTSFHIVLFFNQKVKYENYGMERMAEFFAEGSDEAPPQDYS